MPSHPHRACIIDASNTGKTNMLMNIINESKNLHKIYLHSKTLDDALYQCFIDNWTRRGESMDFEILEYSNDINGIFDLNTVDQTVRNLIVYDDMVCERNINKVSELFLRGRKSNCPIIFISQSYFGMLTQVRINSDYFILTINLKGNELIQVAKDYRGILSIDNFKEMYRNSTRSGYDFFIIDLRNKDDNYRFRKNLNYSLVKSIDLI